MHPGSKEEKFNKAVDTEDVKFIQRSETEEEAAQASKQPNRKHKSQKQFLKINVEAIHKNKRKVSQSSLASSRGLNLLPVLDIPDDNQLKADIDEL